VQRFEVQLQSATRTYITNQGFLSREILTHPEP